MRRRFVSLVSGVVVILGVILVGGALAQTGDGYVGVYRNAAGTLPCTTIPQGTGKTLYVIAKTAGASANGITGAEFRIEVTNPSGWDFSYTAPSGSLPLGDPLDLDPGEPNDGSGLTIAFSSCHEPVAGNVSLGTVHVWNDSGGPTTLLVKRRSTPTNPGFQCPLFILCDDPVFSKVCMTSAPPDSCMLDAQKAGASAVEDDAAVFVGGLNTAAPGGEPGAPVSRVIAMFSSRSTIQLPQGESEAAIGATTVNSAALSSVLQAHGVTGVGAAFPEFDLADTVTVTRTGLVVPLTDYSRIYTLTMPPGSDDDALVADLNRTNGVVFAEPEGILGYSRPCTYWSPCPATIDCPSDPWFEYQWYAYHAGGVIQGTCGLDAKLLPTWNIFLSQGFPVGSSSTKIGIIDSGIWAGHPDLMGKLLGDTGFRGSDGHGTEVTGIAAAYGGNGRGIAGVNWNAQVVFKATGNNDNNVGDFEHLAQDIRDAVSLGASVLNASWHLESDCHTYSSNLIQAVLTDAYKQNRLVVAAGGNSEICDESVPSGTPIYPAAFPRVIAVASHDGFGNRSYDSSTGPHIALAAPGENMMTTADSLLTGEAYHYYQVGGTSYSAPVVTGIASLIYGMYAASIHNDDIRETLIRTASNWPSHTNGLGYGRVNAYRAVRYQADEKVLLYEGFSGGTITSSTGSIGHVFYVAPPGQSPGNYLVKKHEVRRYCPFDFLRGNVAPAVWARGVETLGYSVENPNFAAGWCEPFDVTVDGCWVRTFIYEVWTLEGEWRGWWPTTASNVFFPLTIAEDVEFYTTDAGSENAPAGSSVWLSVANPFRPSGSVILNVVRPGDASVEVYNIAGRLVRTLHNGVLSAGRVVLPWDGRTTDGRPLSNGIYLVRASAAGERTVRKVVLVR